MTKLFSIETPFNSDYPWIVRRNIQYGIQANKDACQSLNATWVPQLSNTQVVKWGLDGYLGDSFAACAVKLLPKSWTQKYGIGREKTLEVTNDIRKTKVDKVLVYRDFGISSGMKSAIKVAEENGVEIEYRNLPKDKLNNVIGQSFMSTFVPLSKLGISSSLITYGLFNVIKKIRI